MAKLKTNHRKAHSISLLRVFILIPIGSALLVLGIRELEKWRKTTAPASSFSNTSTEDENQELIAIANTLRFYLPEGGEGSIVHHRHYSLSYVEKYELSEWVAYILTRAQLNQPKFARPDQFIPDYAVKSGSAFHRDYTGSGYTRGHLVPAADMAWDSIALRETFYMSNIAPQRKYFNEGVWRELEEQTRDWVRKYRRLYVISGPVLSSIQGRIGYNRVGVPGLFFKVLLDLDEPEQKSIGFLIPNELSSEPLTNYAVSVDSVEQLTGLDFFSELIDDRKEEKIESIYQIGLWPFHPQRFQWRVSEWNKR